MLKIARSVSLFLLALALGVSFSHLLQWGPKATLSASDFLIVQQVLLRRYGAVIGWVEGLAVVAVGFVAFLVRVNKRLLALSLAALICTVAMIAVWAIWIEPINAAVNSWSPTSLPDHWQHARDSWHRLHAIRSAQSVLAFGLFIWAALDGTVPGE